MFARRLAITLCGLVSLAVAATPAAAATAPEGLGLLTQHDLLSRQWAMTSANVFEAHTVSTGTGVTVAVIDSGVDGSHPDLAGQVLAGMDFTKRTPAPVPAGGNSDSLGHGTHVAATIAALADGRGITGVAPGVKILPVRVLGGGDPEMEKTSIQNGIRWAVDNGANIMNLSLGGDVNVLGSIGDQICAAVAYAVSRNVLVIAASGNEGAEGNPLNVPASCPGALSVTAIGPDGRAAYFTSFDATAGVAAPGVNVLSAQPFAKDATGYAEQSGTSMAAPHVAGVAALVWSANPALGANGVRKALVETARDLGPVGLDPVYGAGLVDAGRAVGARSDAVRAVPHVHVQLGARSNEIAQLTWSPPGDAVVSQYEVSAFGDGTALLAVPGGTVRASVPVVASARLVTVTAVLANGDRVASTPVLVPGTGTKDSAAAALPEVSGMRAKWTKTGIEVTWKDVTHASELELELMDTVSVTVKAQARRALIPVDSDSEHRSEFSQILALVDGQTVHSVALKPQYTISVTAETAGRNHVAVHGELFCEKQCSGRPVTIEGSTGRVLATVYTTSDGTFMATLTSTERIRVKSGSATSNWVFVDAR